VARTLLGWLTMTFEDDLTRELPSALRTFTDLEPYRSATEIADEDILEDDEVLRSGRTLQLPPASRPLSIPAFSHDIAAPPPGASRMEALLREPLAQVVAAALLLSFVSAGALGIAMGRAASGAALHARMPRSPVVLTAHEVITEPPVTASMKLTFEPIEPSAPLPAPRPVVRITRRPEPPPQPARRAGFQRPIGLAPQPAPQPPRAHR
jgi:hypothetical protein